MHRIVTTVVGVTVATAVLTAGCSSSAQPGTPRATSGGTASSASSPSSSNGAPHVATPLDTSKFQAAPCTVLSAQDTQTLGFDTPGKVSTNSLGPACRWSNLNTGVSMRIALTTANKEGLGSLYRQRGSFELFQPLPDVQGYPAVAYGSIDSRKNGTCSVALGPSDTLDIDIALDAANGPLKADPCGAGQQVAGMVVKNLKGGS